MPNDNGLDTLVADPDFAKLAPADQRRAMAGVSGDDSFAQLNDAQTGRYIAGHQAALPPSQSVAPGTFQTRPRGPLLNVDTLGSQPLTPIPGTSPGTAAKARAALPQFPQQVQQSKNEEAAMLPEVGATVMSEGGPVGMALGAAAGTLLKPFLNGEKADLNDAATNALKTYMASKAFDVLPVAAKNVYHFFAGDTSEAAAQRAMNAVLGVKASQVKMPIGTSDLGDAWIMPGRSVINETGMSAAEMAKLSPLEQAGVIKPHLDAAGRKVANIADQATKTGVTVDVDKSITDGLSKIDDPVVRLRAQQVVNRIAQEVGLQPGLAWKAATPNDVLSLRQSLWNELPSRYRSEIYGNVTGDLKAAVPDLRPADQVYGELRAASDATKSKSQKFAVTAPQSDFSKLAKKALPYAIGATGVAAPELVYQSLKALRGGSDH